MTDPTDEEIMELMPQQMRDDLAAALRALAVRIYGADPIRQDILDIAAELENQ